MKLNGDLQSTLGQNEMDAIRAFYETMKQDYDRALQTEIFETDILPKLISPNQLHRRFPKTVHLLKTELYDQIKDIIDFQVNNNQDEIILKGPMGIGKSHALLAEVLRLRKDGNIVIYFNNTDTWIEDSKHFQYFIDELIYGAIPLSGQIGRPIDVNAPQGTDNLLQWYWLLKCKMKISAIEAEKVIKKFGQELANATSLYLRKIFVVCDQENSLMRHEGKYHNLFPFSYRNQIGDYRIKSMSANNDPVFLSPDRRVFSVYNRMTGIFKICFS